MPVRLKTIALFHDGKKRVQDYLQAKSLCLIKQPILDIIYKERVRTLRLAITANFIAIGLRIRCLDVRTRNDDAVFVERGKTSLSGIIRRHQSNQKKFTQKLTGSQQMKDTPIATHLNVGQGEWIRAGEKMTRL